MCREIIHNEKKERQLYSKNKKRNIIYIDQLASPDKNKIKGEYDLINDVQAAKRFGARSIKEYSYWSWRACAITCLAMVLQAEQKFEGKLFDLVQEALLMNGYAFRNLHGKTDIGWKHNCLVAISKKRNLRSESLKTTNIQSIIKNIQDGKYCIASVRSKRGGHMVLIKKVLNNRFEVNDPGYFKGGESIFWTYTEFLNKYLGKVIYVWN